MTQIIAHRSARNLWAENSLQGFRNVVALGVGAAELGTLLARLTQHSVEAVPTP
ncbi:hypothetical protein [Pseudosulfitobacter pseudonitzschiae]|uniref:hypothetical protein n=1 Tax=Pseudosulfitobacter pseudonitzschiae TaxID=1402135 RepID=UPI001CCE1352|nr:hypothetical protein [Pseudosulfitobacter pseudonitzschiae]MCA0136998.1 hypothetical protein [Pseudosulfitobacter pseudonitzschiae]MCD2328251.1 hypothetical protein [Pseudosulfitobacter pseudonitzschiae]MCD2353010.1 hypothetical protein [Pseudosulfitobacter pseudonitzschiae]MCI2214294.1 hypothetical protein [Pseudosulfitobacter pseudonitzschiae]UFE30439.1 hypothetical protein LOE41_09075 [Pseudosulfitobacter pseudonitzschiae]